jgi:hypothetical protein
MVEKNHTIVLMCINLCEVKEPVLVGLNPFVEISITFNTQEES